MTRAFTLGARTIKVVCPDDLTDADINRLSEQIENELEHTVDELLKGRLEDIDPRLIVTVN